jgi:hypothetical protein
MKKDFETLRNIVDGTDSFVFGHQVGHPRAYTRKTPLWANNVEAFKKILLLSFPKLGSVPKQRKAAARWTRIVYLYFKLHYTYKQIAREMSEKPTQIKASLMHIRRVSRGLAANGNGVRAQKRGRPWPSKINRAPQS